jgi:hypothetical protein
MQCIKPRCDLAFIAFNVDGFNVVANVCDVALPVFDGERSVLRTRVCNTQLLYPRYWVSNLGYRLDLYLYPCLWYSFIDQGEFLNTPVLMASEMYNCAVGVPNSMDFIFKAT